MGVGQATGYPLVGGRLLAKRRGDGRGARLRRVGAAPLIHGVIGADLGRVGLGLMVDVRWAIGFGCVYAVGIGVCCYATINTITISLFPFSVGGLRPLNTDPN